MTRHGRNRFCLVLASLLFLLAQSCTSTEISPATTIFREKGLTWAQCKGENAPALPFECGFVDVPLDYQNPSSRTITIALVRLPAMDQYEKNGEYSGNTYRGVILSNPGGPGSSGIDFLVSVGPELVASLDLGNFDLVSFDPRGVDRSGGLRCYTDSELDKFLYLDWTPDNETEQLLFDEHQNDESTCHSKIGDSIKFYSTENTARDLDLLREAMNVEQINFLGFSYGTYLGGVYATLFPDRIMTMALDAAFDPQGDTTEDIYLTQAVGFEMAFNKWAKWCEDSTACEFRTQDVADRWSDLYDRLDRSPLVDSGGREVNHEVLMVATKSALYAESAWSYLATVLYETENENPDRLIRLADSYNDRQDDGTYLTTRDSSHIIRCASGFGGELPEDIKGLVKQLHEFAPWYSRGVSESDFDEPDCEEIFRDSKLFDIDFKGRAPILVIGGENDPATPIRWSEEMVLNLGMRASLVKYSGQGHGQILSSKCVDAIVSRLYNSRIVPKSGSVCNPDKPISRPGWWSLLPLENFGQLLDNVVMTSIMDSDTSDYYSEFYSIHGITEDVFSQIVKDIRNAGFDDDCNSRRPPVDDTCYFWLDKERVVGVVVYSNESIRELFEPQGPVPLGTTLIEFYYWPMED